jgi:hypothetical protein
MYFGGRGVPQNYVAARMWLNLAAAGGIEDAAECPHRERSAQISQAQRLARECANGNRAKITKLRSAWSVTYLSLLKTLKRP